MRYDFLILTYNYKARLIKLTMLESRLSYHSNTSLNPLPKKEQWALIYQHRALELERAKSMEKVITHQKQDNFKKQLDSQLQLKHNKGAAEKEENKRYFEYIMQKAQEMKEKEEKQKFQKYVATKQLMEANRHIIEAHQDAKAAEPSKAYSMEIGLKSEQEKKERAQAIKREMIQSVERQKMQRERERQLQREKQAAETQRNEEYQKSKFQGRTHKNKKYQQNQAVYDYYRDIFNENRKKDQELQRKLVDDVQLRRQQEDANKQQQQLIEKQRRDLDMKDTLSRQLQLLQHKRQEDKANPEQVTYSFISNIFREKKPAFDKQEYSLYLEKQAQQQRYNKLQQKYMNDEQYRLNSNQLNKAINGTYTFDNYQDRSAIAIGDKKTNHPVQPLDVPDAELVKNKLQDARNHRRSRSIAHSPDNSALF